MMGKYKQNLQCMYIPGRTRTMYPKPTMKRKMIRVTTIFITGNLSPTGNCPEVLNLRILAASHNGERMRKRMIEIVMKEAQLSNFTTARKNVTIKKKKKPKNQKMLNFSADQRFFEILSQAFS